jgi:1-acyl-sn-glycerol-3-phosphate acyltransferase
LFNNQSIFVILIAYLAWPFRIIYTIYAFTCFVLLMLLIFPFVFIASLWGKVRGGNLIYHILRIWSAAWFFLIGIRHKNIYQSKPDPKKQYIFVINHISYLDAAILVETIRQPFRPLGKVEISKVPVFGFIYKACVVMVDRNDADNRAKSLRQLKSVLKKGISIMIFPEGTFNETGQPLKPFYDGAFRIAIETQTPIQPVLFLDTFARMHHKHMFTLNPGRSRSLFLEPIPVDGLTLADAKSLKEKVFKIMEENLVSFAALR